jgi:CheY-like chemotaxis protein
MTRKALIVEDNPARAARLLAAAQRHAFDCRHAETGHAAITALREPHALVLLGHDLRERLPPEKAATARNGYHVALALARAAHHPPPFVVVHASDGAGAARMADVLTRAGIAHAWLPFDSWSDAAFDRIMAGLVP